MKRNGSSDSRNEVRRAVFDFVLIALFLFAIFGILTVHVLHGRDRHREYLEREEQARKEEIVRDEETRRASFSAGSTGNASGAFVSSSTDASSTPTSDDIVASLVPSIETNTSTDVALQTYGKVMQGYVRFEDVTAVRYQNDRLGFVVELPANWPLAYERHDTVAFANRSFRAGINAEDIPREGGAMWISVVRPCTSTEATSTIFRFASTSQSYVREASACIAPFLVTLGYRADTTERLSRERFLLSIARTFYPMVQGVPPYLPLR